MKRYFLRLLVFLITFTFGFLAAPVRFTPMGSGIGLTEDGQHTCYFKPYDSTYLATVVVSSCSYDDESEAENAMVQESQKYRIISATDSRYIVSYSIEGKNYPCIFRLDGNHVIYICSTSLWQALLLEKQKF